MGESSIEPEHTDLEKMKEAIDRIERGLLDLKKLGGEMPVIEKNVRAMMSFIHALKFGISDLAEFGGK
jgi:hypothetical protein